MTVEALTMSAEAAKPTEGPCRERHVLSVVMENKPLTCNLSRQMGSPHACSAQDLRDWLCQAK